MPVSRRPSPFGLLIPLALVSIASLVEARDGRRDRPPNSLRPPAERRTVRVVHEHRRVRQCRRVVNDQRTRCVPELTSANAATTVSFESLSAPTSVADDARGRVIVALPAGLGLQEASAQLAPGQWLVDWHGSARCANLAVLPTSAPFISLETVSGRCELRGARCRLHEDAVFQRMTISD